jgi:hypothetical protein
MPAFYIARHREAAWPRALATTDRVVKPRAQLRRAAILHQTLAPIAASRAGEP